MQKQQKEKEELMKKFQDMLEKFSMMKFELSQMKRLIFGSKRERFVSGAEDGQMSLPFDLETASQEENSKLATEEVSSFQRRKRRATLVVWPFRIIFRWRRLS